MIKLCKIGVALGGGGARGLAHLGVLSALEKEGIAVDLIAGTSMGALVAAVYGLSPQCVLVIERFRQYLKSKEFQKTNLEFLHDRDEFPHLEGIFQRFTNFIRKGIFYSQALTKQAPISEESFAQNINFLLDDVEIQQTRIPLAVIALDLKSAEEVVLRKGSLRKAVSASCAIPGILPPVKFDGRELVDGGWVDRVPVRPVREMGADLVIAVDVAEGLDDTEDFSTGLGIVLRANEINRFILSQLQLKEADVIILPDVSGVHWSDFNHLNQCLRAGEQAAYEKLGDIKKLIKRKKIKKVFSLPFGRASFS
ncbi:MAG: patatin-like phospholipase family protein [Thermodesulfobacteriota bacterium]|nr:patatin-like phospholipase family protein [Thermodesulfobacteriota bacterium]